MKLFSDFIKRNTFLCVVTIFSIGVSQNTTAQIIFSEFFDEADGATTGTENSGNGVSWTSDCPACVSGDWWEVRSGKFEGTDTNGPASFTSGVINTSSCSNVIIDFEISETGTMEACGTGCNSVDYVQLEYRIDGGGWQSPANSYNCSGTCAGINVIHSDDIPGGSMLYSTGCIPSGNTLEFRITVQTWAANETWMIDEIVVSCSSNEPGIDDDVEVCSNDNAINLINELGGTPSAGGTWSGPSALSNGSDGTYIPGSNIAGTYTYTVGAAGCQSSATVEVIEYAAPSFAVSGQDLTSCTNDDGQIIITGLAANSPYSVTYNDGSVVGPINMNTNGVGEIIIDNLPVGSYTNFSLSTLAGCSTMNATVINLTAPSSPSINAGLDQEICDGDDITLTANNPDGAIINWDLGVIDGNAFSPSQTETYTVTASLNGCTSTDDVEVVVNPLPVVNFPAVNSLCINDASVDFAGTPVGGNYTGNGVVGTTFDPAVATVGNHAITYTVTQNGCTNDESISITVNDLDNSNFNYTNTTYCLGGTNPLPTIVGVIGGTFSANSTDVILDPNSGEIDLASSLVGNYDITYATNGACPSSTVFSLSIVNAPNADFVFDQLSYCTNDINVPVITPVVNSGTYSCLDNGLSITPSGDIDLANSNPGTYTVVHELNQAGCPFSQSTTDITIKGLPTASITGGGDVCPGSLLPDVQITTTGAGPWSVDYTQNGNAQNAQITDNTNPYVLSNTQVGTYNLVSVTDLNCSNTANGQVIVGNLNAPVMTVIPDVTICSGDVFNGQQFSSNDPNATYDWVVQSGNDMGFGTNGVGDLPNFSAPSLMQSQTETIVVTPTSANGCVGAAITFNITIAPLPVVQFTADVISGCEPLVVHFSSTTAGVQFDWDFGDGTSSSTAASSVEHTFSNGNFDIELEVTNASGCTGSLIKTQLISANSSPVADFYADKQQITVEDLSVYFQNRSTGAIDYTWVIEGVNDTMYSDNLDYIFPETPDVTYVVTLIAENNGCIDLASTEIKVEDELLFYVPNAFTPDGDFHNPTFQPVFTTGFDPYGYRLMIFNRWGEPLFESQNAQVGWDGTYQGKPVSDGVYIWRIDFKTKYSDDKITKKGHVSVLR